MLKLPDSVQIQLIIRQPISARDMSQFTQRLIVWLVIILLAGCSSSRPRAPVISPGETRGPIFDKYLVARGDTLFSIAWRYGLDFRKLANANRIAAPYTIYPNQELILEEVSRASAQVNQMPARVASTPVKTATKPPVKVVQPATKTQEPLTKSVANSNPSADPDSWRWPAAGRVVKAYGASGAHKGIDIGGELGEPVISAAPGKVVYAGSGILGYGNLLIVKHSDRYLSAYGHNDRLLVKEGAAVTGGQKIAEIGDSGTNSVKLHFEIRRAGKPIDPIRLLPRR